MEIPHSIQSPLDFYDYCLLMSGAPRRADCITIRLRDTRLKLESSYTVSREDEAILGSVLSSIQSGKVRIQEVTSSVNNFQEEE